ncbi:MAG: Mu-like prophage major head subunit gpT family protein [Treponemataceae bacterium]
MSIIKDSTLESLRTMVKGEFKQRLSELEGMDNYKKIVTIITSNSASNTYGWLGSFPKLKEWVGRRTLESIKESSYVLKNERHEATLQVKRTDIEDDNFGFYGTMSRSMADEVISFYNRKIALLLRKGFENLCFDGQNFFDDEHPVYEKADGTGATSFVSNILGDKNATGSAWFLLSCSSTLKPLILQERMAPQLEEITDTKNDTVFMEDAYLYGIRWRGNFGYGFWQNAIGSKEPLTAQNYQKARVMMQQFKRDGGDPMGIMPTHLVVSVDNEESARKIIEMQIVDNNSNVNYKTAELLVSPWLEVSNPTPAK